MPADSIEPASTVAAIVADLLAPLVRAHDLGTLLDVQAEVAKSIGEAQRGYSARKFLQGISKNKSL
jgi:hypothetical protein